MTGRERLTNILNKQPSDRLCWTTLVDDLSRSVMPPEVRALPPFEFYRFIGCDILQFGNYGLPKGERVEPPYRLVRPPLEIEEQTDADGFLVRRTRTEWGTLTATFKSGHPVKHPVESVQELRILREVWQASRYEERDGAEESWQRVEKAIGESGIYAPTTAPSPVQQLIELDMGLANFYYLLADYRREVEELLEAMHRQRLEEYEMLARRSPAALIIPVENTSATLTSPAVYRRYSLPQIRDYADIVHRRGKKLVLHMCGKLRDLLPAIKEAGCDGINALTPPTVGDTSIEDALDALGEDFLLLGAVFNGNVFQKPQVTREEIRRELERTCTARARSARLLLWLPADGLPTPLERFLAVREWMEENGRL